MTAYRYVALDAQGRRHEGIHEADQPRAVRAWLREKGWIAESVSATEDVARMTRGLFRKRVPAGELALFARQFAVLLNAGLTIERALAALIEQAEAGPLRAVLQDVRADVIAGHGLAASFERQGRDFPGHFAAVVRAGEEAGALAPVMERMADALERGHALRQKVGLALIYPAIVTVVAGLVVGVLLTYVVPQVVSVFEHSKQGLPWLTRAMLWLSGFLRATWWGWLIALVAGAWLGRRLLAIEALRLRWHAMLLRLPILGRLRNAIASARFAQTLAVLTASGVPVVAAFGHAAAALDDRVFRGAAERAATGVREGMAISKAMRAEGVFPPMLLHLVASGEASGELPRVLEQAAHQQEMLVAARLATLTALLEPLLILLMGGVVLVIVLATLQPIIEMNALIK
jgi:general secretion pathway protein F